LVEKWFHKVYPVSRCHMTDKQPKELIADIVTLEANLKAIHENYIIQREQAVAPLKEKYDAHRRKLEVKRRELKGLLKDCIVQCVMEPGTKVTTDDRCYGYETPAEVDANQ